jgi:hypothetical protein
MPRNSDELRLVEKRADEYDARVVRLDVKNEPVLYDT